MEVLLMIIIIVQSAVIGYLMKDYKRTTHNKITEADDVRKRREERDRQWGNVFDYGEEVAIRGRE